MLRGKAVAIMTKKRTFFQLLLVLAAGFSLSACSTLGYNSSSASMSGNSDISDPFEAGNRFVFAFNNAIDDAFIHPIALGYREVTPEPARTGFSNFLRNLKSPLTFANQLLQGDIGGAGDVLGRAALNTVVGIGGIFDVAKEVGFEYESEDFGQTLAVWGVGHGPYLVLPFLGPSSARDYAGYFIDAFADPLRWYLFSKDEEEWYYAKIGADYLTLRESLVDVLAEIEKSSIDYYAAVRSTYYQRRRALVNDNDGEIFESPAIPDFDDEGYQEL